MANPFVPLHLYYIVVKTLALLLKGNSIDNLLPHARDRSPAALIRVSFHLHVVQSLLQLGCVHRLIVNELLSRWRRTLLSLGRRKPVEGHCLTVLRVDRKLSDLDAESLFPLTLQDLVPC